MGIKLCSNINRSFQQYIFYTEQHCKNTGDSEKIIYLLPRKENINSLSHIVKVQPEQRPIPVASRTVNSQPVPWNKVVKGETQKEGGEWNDILSWTHHRWDVHSPWLWGSPCSQTPGGCRSRSQRPPPRRCLRPGCLWRARLTPPLPC